MSGIALGLGAAALVGGGFAIAKGQKQKEEGKAQKAEAFSRRVTQMQNEALAARGENVANREGLMRSLGENLEETQQTGQSVLAQQRQMAQEGMPEEAYLAQQEAIDRQASAGVQYLQGSRAGIRGIGALNRSTLDSYRQLNAMDAQQRLMNKQNYIQAQTQQQQLENQARYQLGAAQQQEFIRRQGLMYELAGLGTQNIVGGLESQGQGAGQIAMGLGYATSGAKSAGAFGGGGGGNPQAQGGMGSNYTPMESNAPDAANYSGIG